MDPSQDLTARACAMDCVAAAARELPRTVIESVASALDALEGTALTEQRIERLIDKIQGFSHRLQLQMLFRCLQGSGADLAPSALAWALRGAAAQDAGMRDNHRVDLVWTGPQTTALKSRLSYGALIEVIDSSRLTLTIATFTAYRIDAVRAAILRAVERGVAVRLILESASASAGKIAHEPIDAFDLGLDTGVEVYVWPLAHRPTNGTGQYGTLHMKCALADECLILISSANLTEFALDLNMELGVMLRSAVLGQQLEKHFDALIQQDILQAAAR